MRQGQRASPRHAPLHMAGNLDSEVPILPSSHSKAMGTSPARTPGLGLSSSEHQESSLTIWPLGRQIPLSPGDKGGEVRGNAGVGGGEWERRSQESLNRPSPCETFNSV